MPHYLMIQLLVVMAKVPKTVMFFYEMNVHCQTYLTVCLPNNQSKNICKLLLVLFTLFVNE